MKIRTKRTRALQLDERRTTIGSACFITVLIGPAIARDRNSTFFFFFLCGTKKRFALCAATQRARVQTLVIYRRHVHVNYREPLVKLAVFIMGTEKENHTHTGSG